MYITQESDYAVRIMNCLSVATERRDARSISEEVNVTLRFSLKILGKLSAAGLVNSFKGNRGGYEIAKSPDKISVYDIIEVTEGPFVFSRCLKDHDACSRNATAYCVFHRGFDVISNNINLLLKKMTLQDAIDGSFFGDEAIGELLAQ